MMPGTPSQTIGPFFAPALGPGRTDLTDGRDGIVISGRAASLPAAIKGSTPSPMVMAALSPEMPAPMMTNPVPAHS